MQIFGTPSASARKHVDEKPRRGRREVTMTNNSFGEFYASSSSEEQTDGNSRKNPPSQDPNVYTPETDRLMEVANEAAQDLQVVAGTHPGTVTPSTARKRRDQVAGAKPSPSKAENFGDAPYPVRPDLRVPAENIPLDSKLPFKQDHTAGEHAPEFYDARGVPTALFDEFGNPIRTSLHIEHAALMKCDAENNAKMAAKQDADDDARSTYSSASQKEIKRLREALLEQQEALLERDAMLESNVAEMDSLRASVEHEKSATERIRKIAGLPSLEEMTKKEREQEDRKAELIELEQRIRQDEPVLPSVFHGRAQPRHVGVDILQKIHETTTDEPRRLRTVTDIYGKHKTVRPSYMSDIAVSHMPPAFRQVGQAYDSCYREGSAFSEGLIQPLLRPADLQLPRAAFLDTLDNDNVSAMTEEVPPAPPDSPTVLPDTSLAQVTHVGVDSMKKGRRSTHQQANRHQSAATPNRTQAHRSGGILRTPGQPRSNRSGHSPSPAQAETEATDPDPSDSSSTSSSSSSSSSSASSQRRSKRDEKKKKKKKKTKTTRKKREKKKKKSSSDQDARHQPDRGSGDQDARPDRGSSDQDAPPQFDRGTKFSNTFANNHDFNSYDERQLCQLTNMYATSDPAENLYLQQRQGQLFLYAGDLSQKLGFPEDSIPVILSVFQQLMKNWTRNDRYHGPSHKALDELAKTDIYKSLYLENLSPDEILRWYTTLQPVLLKKCIALMPLKVLRSSDGRVGFCHPFVGWGMYSEMTEALFDFIAPLLPEQMTDIVETMQDLLRDGYKLMLLIFQKAIPSFCPSAVLEKPTYDETKTPIQYQRTWKNFWILQSKEPGPVPNDATKCLQMLTHITAGSRLRQLSAPYEIQLEEYTDGIAALPKRLQADEVAASLAKRLADSTAGLGTRVQMIDADTQSPERLRLVTLEEEVRGLRHQVHGLSITPTAADARADLILDDEAYVICKTAFMEHGRSAGGDKRPKQDRPQRQPRDYTHVCEVCKSQGCAPQGPQGCRWIRGGINFLHYLKDPTKRAAAEKMAAEWAEGSKRRAEEYSKKVAKSAVNYLAHHDLTLDEAIAQMEEQSV